MRMAAELLDSPERPGRGLPNDVADLCSLICAMEIGLREEEFTHEEALALIAAWLQGGCPR